MSRILRGNTKAPKKLLLHTPTGEYAPGVAILQAVIHRLAPIWFLTSANDGVMCAACPLGVSMLKSQ